MTTTREGADEHGRRGAVGRRWGLARAVTLLVVCAAAVAALSPWPNAAQAQPRGGGGAGDSAMSDVVVFHTTMGRIAIELDAERAPITTDNFLQYVADGHYDGTVFHRVIPGFVVQGGGFTPSLDQKPTRDGIRNEWQNGLKNDRGTISMARLGGQPDSATSQFFLNLTDNAALDAARDGAAYAVFGRVSAGMDVVDRIAGVRTATVNWGGEVRAGRGQTMIQGGRTLQDVPIADVVVERAVRLTEGQAERLSADPAAIAELDLGSDEPRTPRGR